MPDTTEYRRGYLDGLHDATLRLYQAARAEYHGGDGSAVLVAARELARESGHELDEVTTAERPVEVAERGSWMDEVA